MGKAALSMQILIMMVLKILYLQMQVQTLGQSVGTQIDSYRNIEGSDLEEITLPLEVNDYTSRI